MAEFIDYKKNPGYWFLIQLSIAEEVCKHPKHGAKYNTNELNEIDYLDAFDEGMAIYNHTERLFKMRY